MKTIELENFLKSYLNTFNFNDYAPNGLQIEAKDNISKIALGVSSSMALFKKAKLINADAIIVHHGLFWAKQTEPLKGILAERIKFLFKNDINLFGYHLPLDQHPEIGNNACIANLLKLENKKPFAKHGGVEIGIIGDLNKQISIAVIEKLLLSEFKQMNYKFYFGKKIIKTIAIVSGGAANDVYEAALKGADLYITGEASEPVFEWLKEAKMNFIALGHYVSESLGIKKLGEIITNKFNIECVYIDIPNKL